MLLVVDARDPDPVYLQIYRQVIDAIATGTVREGDTLPSTRQLAGDLGVNYHTVHKAYELLVARGAIAMAPRSRAVVRAADTQGPTAEWLARWSDQVRGLLAEAIALGVAPAEVDSRLRRLVTDLTA